MDFNTTEIKEVALDYVQNHLQSDVTKFIPYLSQFNYENIFYLIDFLCAANLGYDLRKQQKSTGIPLSPVSTLLAVFTTYIGGSATRLLCGLPIGLFYHSYYAISLILGWAFIFAMPFDLGFTLFNKSYILGFIRYIFGFFISTYCIADWGSDVAIEQQFSFSAALLCGLITSCLFSAMHTVYFIPNGETGFFKSVNYIYKKNESSWNRNLFLTIFYLVIRNPYGYIPNMPIIPIEECHFYLFTVIVILSLLKDVLRIDICTIIVHLLSYLMWFNQSDIKIESKTKSNTEIKAEEKVSEEKETKHFSNNVPKANKKAKKSKKD
ncbi:hypothetical protein WA158_004100 [Blastocystis sp. Blastoise]